MKIKIKKNNKFTYTISDFMLKNISKNKYLILDLESTGLDVVNDEITEIAFMPITTGVEILLKPWSSLIKSPKPIPENIASLTGIENEDIKNSPSLKSVLGKMVLDYGDFVWVAQCGFEFDFPILINKYKKNFGKKLNITFLDTKLMYLYLHRDAADTISTNYLIKNFGIDDSHIERHRASGDVELISSVFLRILKEYKYKGIDEIDLKEELIVKKFIPS